MSCGDERDECKRTADDASKKRLDGIKTGELLCPGKSMADTALLHQMSVEAKKYLEGFEWCGSAAPAYWGGGVGGVFGIFLFEIEAKASDVDRWLWVIIGDIPPLYVVLDECRSPQQATEMYLKLMGEWVELARHGQTSPDLPPTGVERHLSGQRTWIGGSPSFATTSDPRP
jgi:hypothetical protein